MPNLERRRGSPMKKRLQKRFLWNILLVILIFLLPCAAFFYSLHELIVVIQSQEEIKLSVRPDSTQASAQHQEERSGDRVEIAVTDCQAEQERLFDYHCTDITSSKDLMIMMAAIPHTASTSTDNLFQAGTALSWNSTISHQQRGFTCPNDKGISPLVVVPLGCSSSPDGDKTKADVTDKLLRCILGKLQHKTKRHHNYAANLRMHPAVLFTTLRMPDQFILSQYNMRKAWDYLWLQEYPLQNGTTAAASNHTTAHSSLDDATPIEWAIKAWWRHNLFTKMLATDTRLIWAHPPPPFINVVPTKEESDCQNTLGNESKWLETALARIKAMPFFGLMHRLSESFELMGFHLCVPVNTVTARYKQPRHVSPELQSVADRYFVLDKLLVQMAEPLFEELVTDMRQQKAQGVLCNLSKSLGARADIGLQCSVD